MLASRRIVALAVVPLALLGRSVAALAQQPGPPERSESIDDPKVERRLGARVDLGEGAGAPARDASVAPGVEEAPAASAQAPALASSPWAASPRGTGSPAPRGPRVKVAYRRFMFAQIGATATSGPAASEPFSVVSLDLYPVSSSWRLGLSSQYGWEEGTFRANGDAFLAQSISLGGQVRGEVFTPFFEVHAGGGLMQRTHAGLNTIATAYGQLGVDVGSELFLARYACLSAAVGYLRGTNGFAKGNIFGSFSVNTWAFKLGFGL